MALSKLSGDEQGILFVQLCNVLDPGIAVALSSVNNELRAATRVPLQQLKTGHEAAAALCRKLGHRNCKALREAKGVWWCHCGLTADELKLLGTLGSVLPALKELALKEPAAGPDGVQQLAAGLGAGALPAVAWLCIYTTHVGDAGASALAAALGQGALPRLKSLELCDAAIGDAGLVALAPALRRRPALKCLSFSYNPIGDEGLAALVAPPRPDGAPTTTTGGLAKLTELYLRHTQVTDAGCAALTAALDSGALPALGVLKLDGIPASAAATAAVYVACDLCSKRRAAAAASASELQQVGKQAYKLRNFDEAIHFFTLAIDTYADSSAPAFFFTNRSAALYGKERYADALSDADSAVRQRPQWARGHSRRADALRALRRLDDARGAYEKALELDPQNQLVRNSLESLLKLTQEQPAPAAGAGQSPPWTSKQELRVHPPQPSRKEAQQRAEAEQEERRAAVYAWEGERQLNETTTAKQDYRAWPAARRAERDLLASAAAEAAPGISASASLLEQGGAPEGHRACSASRSDYIAREIALPESHTPMAFGLQLNSHGRAPGSEHGEEFFAMLTSGMVHSEAVVTTVLNGQTRVALRVVAARAVGAVHQVVSSREPLPLLDEFALSGIDPAPRGTAELLVRFELTRAAGASTPLLRVTCANQLQQRPGTALPTHA